MLLNNLLRAPGLVCLCAAACFVLAQPVCADPIQAHFYGASLVSSMPDAACPGPAHAEGTYSGPGGGLLNYSPYPYPGQNIPFSATLSLNTCAISDGIPAHGSFTITATGASGAMSGLFYTNADGVGSFQLTGESGIFGDTDTQGFFNPSIYKSKLSVGLVTPEPESNALLGFGLGILALSGAKRRLTASRHTAIGSV